MEAEEDRLARLPDYMVQDILARLNAKSLVRFMCTGRRLCVLAMSQLVIGPQAERSVDNALGLLSVTVSHNGGQLNYLPFDRSEAPDVTLGLAHGNGCRISVRAACNGMVFVRLPIHEQFLIGNLTTKAFRYVQRPLWGLGTRFAIAVDPAVSATVIKLVGCTPEESFFHFDVYSPATDTWRVVNSSVACDEDCRLFDTASQVFYNNALHWTVEDAGDLVAFDVHDERCYRVALPPAMRATRIAGYPSVWLGVVHSKMMLVRFDKGIHVWEMEDYSKGRWGLETFVETPGYSVRCYETSVPVFYDGDKCVLLSWNRTSPDQRQRECGLAVFHIGNGRWDEIQNLEGYMDSSARFLPLYQSHVGVIRMCVVHHTPV